MLTANLVQLWLSQSVSQSVTVSRPSVHADDGYPTQTPHDSEELCYLQAGAGFCTGEKMYRNQRDRHLMLEQEQNRSEAVFG